MKKAFVTLFPDFNNVHFYKDVGMIPHVMSTKYGYDSFVLTCHQQIVPASPFSGTIRIIPIKPLNGLLGLLSCFKTIFNITKDYDYVVLNTYHYRVNFLLLGLVLKVLTKKLSHYVKFDVNAKTVDLMFSNTSWYMKPFRNYFLSKVDVLSVEAKEAYDFFKSTDFLSKNVYLIPNGVKVEDLNKYSDSQILKAKEKIIFTASRLESEQKNIKLLIDSYCKSELSTSNWSLLLAGSSDDIIRQYAFKKAKQYNVEHHNIKFLGMLNRRDLFSMMERAKIFALSSKFEGFSLILPEASAHACLIVSTDVSGVKDITNEGKLGFIAQHNIDDLSDKLILATSSEYEKGNLAIQQREYCLNNFDWNIICSKLNDILNEKIT